MGESGTVSCVIFAGNWRIWVRRTASGWPAGGERLGGEGRAVGRRGLWGRASTGGQTGRVPFQSTGRQASAGREAARPGVDLGAGGWGAVWPSTELASEPSVTVSGSARRQAAQAFEASGFVLQLRVIVD